jgi:hypothetical protein
MTIKLAEHGQHLSSRFTAAAIRETIPELNAPSPVPIRFDFAGILSVTESFMHELLRQPVDVSPADFLSRITFGNCSPVVVQTIQFVVREVLDVKRKPVFA